MVKIEPYFLYLRAKTQNSRITSMENEILFEEDSFSYEVYQRLAPVAKTFLSNYLGEKLNYLEPEKYSQIETAIKRNIYYGADILPDILYRYCTIKDPDEWDKALADFKFENCLIPWHDTQNWFDLDFDPGNDEDYNSFSDYVDYYEISKKQQQLQDSNEAAKAVLKGAHDFAHFIREGYKVLNPATRQFMIDYAIFDLIHLTEEGFIELQKAMDRMNEDMLEELEAITWD